MVVYDYYRSRKTASKTRVLLDFVQEFLELVSYRQDQAKPFVESLHQMVENAGIPTVEQVSPVSFFFFPREGHRC